MSSNTVLERLNSYKDTGLEIPANHVEVGQQPDGEKKYSFKKDDDNSMYKDNNLIDTARAYYYERDGLLFENNNELVDYFIDDRTWKQANSNIIEKE